jgi:hypothetical protein
VVRVVVRTSLLRDVFRAQEAILKYPNLLWAISGRGNRWKFARVMDHSESWLSRRLLGRVEFSSEDRQKIAEALGYPAEWLFQELQPPARVQSPTMENVST